MIKKMKQVKVVHKKQQVHNQLIHVYNMRCLCFEQIKIISLQTLIQMTSQYTAKIISELKQYQTVHINAAGMLYLLNRLISAKNYPLQYIHKFITNTYSHEEIAWKTMDEETIINLHRQSLQYIDRHQKQWKTQTQQQQKLTHEYTQEKKRIKKILKEKSFTKEQLIDTYLEQIRRNKTILLKSSPIKNNQPQIPSKSTTQVNDKYKYQQNMQLLQKRINIMRDSPKFDHENDDKTFTKQGNINFRAQEKQLNQIVEEFQFKKNYFENLQKNSQLQQALQKKKKLTAKTKSLNRRLKQLFLRYSSQNYDPSVSFQKNNKKLVHIDLRLFLKYFKELKDAHSGDYFINDEKNDKKFKTNNLTVVFKKYAKNQREINFIQFLKINYELFLSKENAFYQLTQLQILGEQKEQTKIRSHESLSQFEEELEKLEEIKDIFFNEKVLKIININQKLQDSEFSFQTTQRSKDKNSSEENSNDTQRVTNKKVGKFIDKTLEDYETTKNQIHEIFLRRHRKETVQSFEERLNANQNNGIKIIVSKSKSSIISKMNENGHVLNRKIQGDVKQIHSRNMTDININNANKNIFNQIIREVDDENEEDDNFDKNRYQKSRSYADLLSVKERATTKDSKKVESSLSKRRSSTGSLKSVFTLPKLTRYSEERIENQSITKTLNYLYNKLGKQQEVKIKKILQLDNTESLKANKIQNQYLKEYFSKEGNNQYSKSKQTEENIMHKKQQVVKQKSKKFKDQNYKKFMRFS